MAENHDTEALPCCNWIETADDLDGGPCGGTMQRGWPTYVCDTCGAHCGAQAHPEHPKSPDVNEEADRG